MRHAKDNRQQAVRKVCKQLKVKRGASVSTILRKVEQHADVLQDLLG